MIDARSILDDIARTSGLTFADVRLAGAVEKTQTWLARHQLRDRTDIDGHVLQELLDELVVQESYFDRDLDQLAVIGGALDQLGAAHRHLAVWSAGCAAGEETYSLAFQCAARGLLERTEVLGTDLSRASLLRARAGEYRAWSVRLGAGTPAMQYLQNEAGAYRVPAHVRKAVRFERLDLVEDPYPFQQHVIACRNVLIYFSPAAIARVAVKFAEALTDDGWLFVAPADPRLDDHAPLTAVITDRGVHYRKRAAVSRAPTRPSSPPVSLPEVRRAAPTTPPPVRRAPPPTLPPPPTRTDVAAIRDLADRGDPAGARHALALARAARPLDAELYFLGALLADDRHAAEAEIERAIYLAPEEPLAYMLAGHVRASLGEVERARRAYHTALELLAQLSPVQRPAWSDETSDMLAAAARASLAALA